MEVPKFCYGCRDPKCGGLACHNCAKGRRMTDDCQVCLRIHPNCLWEPVNENKKEG